MSMPILVADIGLNHCGDIALAESMIHLAKACGVDYVKFQKRTVEKAYTKEYLDQPRISRWGTTVRDEKNGLEFGRAEYDRIESVCHALNMLWFASPRTPEDVEFLMQYDPPYMKIASGCLCHVELLKAIRASKVPVIMSTGMSRIEEIGSAISFFRDSKQLMYLLHCRSLYPLPEHEANLMAIRTLRERYGHFCRIGYSHHSKKAILCQAAYMLGAEMIEFHFTADRLLPGGDQEASMGAHGLRWLVEHLRWSESALGDGKLGASQEEFEKGRNYPWRQSLAPTVIAQPNG